MLIKAVANSTTANFIRVVGSEFVQKYLAEGPRIVHDVCRVARENSPAIIFIDEIDAIATKRFDAQGHHGNESCRHTGSCATSSWPVGPQDRISVAKGSKGLRLIFTTISAKMSLSPKVDLDLLVIRNDPLSGAIIAAIMQEAGLRAVGKNCYIIQSDLESSQGGARGG